MSNFKFSANSNRTLDTVRPELALLLGETLYQSQIDFGLVPPSSPGFGGGRSADMQQKLFNAGSSNINGQGIYTKDLNQISYHQTGWAVDFFAYDPEVGAIWEGKEMASIAALATRIGAKRGLVVEWGGHWCSIKDEPHLQVSGKYINGVYYPFKPELYGLALQWNDYLEREHPTLVAKSK